MSGLVGASFAYPREAFSNFPRAARTRVVIPCTDTEPPAHDQLGLTAGLQQTGISGMRCALTRSMRSRSSSH